MVDRHAIADLLTDEMRARLAAVTFVARDGGISTPGDDCRCPFAVALDYAGPGWPDAEEIARVLGTDRVGLINDLIDDFDAGQVEPEDVKAMLGVEARP